MNLQEKKDILEGAEFWQGCLVRSRAGHDTGRTYLVVDYIANESEIRLLLVDGVYRKWLQPKAKNPKQLALLGRLINQAGLAELAELNAESGEQDSIVRRLIKSHLEKERD